MSVLAQTCSSTHLVVALAVTGLSDMVLVETFHQSHPVYSSFCQSVNLTLFMHSFAIADRVSKVNAFMLVVTATQPMNLTIVKCFYFDRLSVNDVCVVWTLSAQLFPFLSYSSNIYDLVIHQLMIFARCVADT